MKALKDEAMVEGSASPRNTTTKKRSLVKEDLDTAAADQNEPAKKKTKPAPKKEKRVKKEGIDGGSEDEPPATKKTKAATKKGRKVKDEETDEEFEEAGLPVKKARSQAKSIKREDGSAVHAKDGSNDHDAQSAPVMKKTRARRKAAKGAKFRYEDADSDEPRQASEVEDSLNKVKLEDGSSDNEAPANGRSPDPTKSSITPVKKAANRIEAMAKVDQGINPKVRILRQLSSYSPS